MKTVPSEDGRHRNVNCLLNRFAINYQLCKIRSNNKVCRIIPKKAVIPNIHARMLLDHLRLNRYAEIMIDNTLVIIPNIRNPHTIVVFSW